MYVVVSAGTTVFLPLLSTLDSRKGGREMRRKKKWKDGDIIIWCWSIWYWQRNECPLSSRRHLRVFRVVRRWAESRATPWGILTWRMVWVIVSSWAAYGKCFSLNWWYLWRESDIRNWDDEFQLLDPLPRMRFLDSVCSVEITHLPSMGMWFGILFWDINLI